MTVRFNSKDKYMLAVFKILATSDDIPGLQNPWNVSAGVTASTGLLKTPRMALIRISRSDKLPEKLRHVNLEALHLAVKNVEAYTRR